jgi:hypothetical protein
MACLLIKIRCRQMREYAQDGDGPFGKNQLCTHALEPWDSPNRPLGVRRIPLMHHTTQRTSPFVAPPPVALQPN